MGSCPWAHIFPKNGTIKPSPQWPQQEPHQQFNCKYGVFSFSGPVVKPAPKLIKKACPLFKHAWLLQVLIGCFLINSWPVLEKGGVRLKLILSPLEASRPCIPEFWLFQWML
jgi:hypothetical protein